MLVCVWVATDRNKVLQFRSHVSNLKRILITIRIPIFRMCKNSSLPGRSSQDGERIPLNVLKLYVEMDPVGGQDLITGTSLTNLVHEISVIAGICTKSQSQSGEFIFLHAGPARQYPHPHHSIIWKNDPDSSSARQILEVKGRHRWNARKLHSSISNGFMPLENWIPL